MDNIFNNSIINQDIFLNELSNNIRCYIIPKKGFLEKQAMVSISYGSADNEFNSDGIDYKMPCGIAHFLEHKLFEEKNINIFEEFSKLGSNVNAFTNFTTTAYYFNCIDNFDKSLELLLKFVSNPYFTEENVEKEKGIIAQEIKMYEDDPNWCVYFNLLDSMYFNNPVKYNIAGNIESINEITKDMLYDCYNTFYSGINTAVVCCGDVDKDSICSQTEKFLNLNNKKNIKRIYGEEPKKVRKKYTEKKMQVERLLFNIGFKETDFDSSIVDRICETKMLMEIILGESSELYEKLYIKGIIDNSFSFEYTNGLSYGCSIFSGNTKNVDELEKYLLEEIENLKNTGISENVFERIQRKCIGRFIRGFNFIDTIASSQVDYFTKQFELCDIINKYENINIDNLMDRLKTHFNQDLLSVSTIIPI